MKLKFMLLFIFIYSLAVFSSADDLVAPLMTFDKRPSIGLSQNNKEFLESSSEIEKEIKRGTETLQSKTIPIAMLFFIVMIFMMVAFIWKYHKEIRERTRKYWEKKISPSLKLSNEIQKIGHFYTNKGKNERSTLISLSNVYRTYLEEQFHIPAQELTSAELIEVIDNHKDMDERSKAFYKKLFGQSDLVKFANYTPNPSELTSLIKTPL